VSYKYYITSAKSLERLERQVSQYLNSGWKLVGHPIVLHESYGQALVKHSDWEDKDIRYAAIRLANFLNARTNRKADVNDSYCEGLVRDVLRHVCQPYTYRPKE
jgi:hypothetical protein